MEWISSMLRRLRLLSLFLALSLCEGALGQNPTVPPPSQQIVAAFKLAPFYRKMIDLQGFPIVGSAKVSDYALKEAAYIVGQMLKGRDDVREALIRGRARLAVMAYNELTTEIPEHSDLTPPKYWDKRARGLGATAERPAVSCAEENLLCYPGDPYRGENILIHEFAHAIHIMGLNAIEPEFDKRLQRIYESAIRKGLWKGTYAATNKEEYWAEGVQSWFDSNQVKNRVHNGVETREKLSAYDPEFAALIASVFPNREWRYQKPADREEKAHLEGYDPAKAPRFAWSPALIAWYNNYIKTHPE
jgi:hypothetical protein